MEEGVFVVLLLGFIWVLFASIHDWIKKEVANWLNFSLIIFVIGFRFFYSFYGGEWSFLIQGVFGIVIFLILGNVFYYSRIFAGGDAKLMIALGGILFFSNSFYENLYYSSFFIFLFLIVGSLYGILWSVILMSRNFKEFKRGFYIEFGKKRVYTYLLFSLGILTMFLGFYFNVFFYIGLLIFLTPYLFLVAKAIDETCMIRKIKTSNLVEGDWLYKDVKVGGKIIKASWEGVSVSDIKLLRKVKEVKVRQGIPFVPVFLISYILWIVIVFVYRLDFFDFRVFF